MGPSHPGGWLGSVETKLAQPRGAEAAAVDGAADQAQLLLELLVVDHLPAIEQFDHGAVMIHAPFLPVAAHGFPLGADAPEIEIVLHRVARRSHERVVEQWRLRPVAFKVWRRLMTVCFFHDNFIS